jgi:hypothetical protein
MSDTYHVFGNHVLKYSILDQGGAVEYHDIQTRTEADEICAVLNRGIGPEWDAVEDALRSEGQEETSPIGDQEEENPDPEEN